MHTSSPSTLPFLPRPLSQDLSWELLLPLALLPSAELPGMSSCTALRNISDQASIIIRS